MKRIALLLTLLFAGLTHATNENLLTWTETDTGGYLAPTTTSVVATSVPRNATAYLYKDFGASHFQDFRIRLTFVGGTCSHSDYSSFLGIVTLANTLTDWENLAATNAFGLRWSRGPSGYYISMSHEPTYTTTWDTGDEGDVSPGTAYYISIYCNYDGGTNSTGRYTLYICTGNYYGESGASTVKTETLDVPAGEQSAFRYAEIAQSRTNSGTQTASGTISNVEFSVPVGGANEYYISPNGSDSSDGSFGSPWQTITKANSTLTAGDTVYLMAGTYTNTIDPANSGTSGNPITYEGFGTDAATITTSGDGADLRSTSYITLDSLRFIDNGGMWVNMQNTTGTSQYNLIQKCYMNRCYSWAGIRMQASTTSYNRIMYNTLIAYYCPDDPIYMRAGANHNLVAGNRISYAAHAPIDNIWGSTYNVIRDNWIWNPWHTGISTYEVSNRTLISGNIILDTGEDAASMPPHPDEVALYPNDYRATDRAKSKQYHHAIQVGSKNCIIRQNVIVNCGDIGFESYDTALCYDNRVYNNTWYGNTNAFVAQGAETTTGNVIKNNIIDECSARPIDMWCDASSYNYFFYNDVIGDVRQVHLDATVDTIDWWDTNYATYFQNNTMADPCFTTVANVSDSNNYGLDVNDLRLAPASDLIDGGTWLTTCVGADTGTTITVADANYFYDGWGITGEVGDTIQLEGQTTTAVITDVNYTDATITVDTSLTWTNGLGVALAYNGSAPDMGLYESGSYTATDLADFTTWTEVDPGSDIAVSDANNVAVTALPGNLSSYLYDDYGTDYFGGDLEMYFRGSVTTAATSAHMGFLGLSNTLSDYQGLIWASADGIYVYWRNVGGVQRIYLTVLDDGSPVSDYTTGTLTTNYYFKLTRDADAGTYSTGLITLCITTGAYYGYGGSVVDTLTVNVPTGEQNDYRYTITAQSSSNQGTAVITGAIGYLDVGTPTEPPVSDPNGAADDPGTHGPYYVSPSGSDTFPGTDEPNAFRTLEYALTYARLDANAVDNVIYMLEGDHGDIQFTSRIWDGNVADWTTNRWRIQGETGAYCRSILIQDVNNAFLDFNDFDVTRSTSHNQNQALIKIDDSNSIKIRNATLTGYWDTSDSLYTTGYGVYINGTEPNDIDVNTCTINKIWTGVYVNGAVRDDIYIQYNTIKNFNQSAYIGNWADGTRDSYGPLYFQYNTCTERTYAKVTSSSSGTPHGAGIGLRGDNVRIIGNRVARYGGSGGIRQYEANGPFDAVDVRDNVFYNDGGIGLIAGFFECGTDCNYVNNTFVSPLRADTSLAAWRYIGSVAIRRAPSVTTPTIEWMNNIVVGLTDIDSITETYVTGGNNLMYSHIQDGAWQSSLDTNDIIVCPAINGPITSGYTSDSFENAGEVFVGGTSFADYFTETGTAPADWQVFALTANSAAVDAGRPSYASTYDVRGVTRDATPDIGAFEYDLDHAPLKARNPIPADDATDVSIDTLLSWDAQGDANDYNIYVGTTSGSMSLQGNVQANSYEYTLDYDTTYYWRVDANNGAGVTTGDEWSFTTDDGLPTAVTGAQPTNGAGNQNTSLTLRWTAATGAIGYDVYFGTDNLALLSSTANTSIATGTLEEDTTYQWRVDAIGPAGTTTGTVWSFTTYDSNDTETDPGQPQLPNLDTLTNLMQRPTFSIRRGIPYHGLALQPVNFPGGLPGTKLVPATVDGYLERIIIFSVGTDTQWSLTIQDAWGGEIFSATDLDMTDGTVAYDGQRIPFVGGMRVTVADTTGDTADDIWIALLIDEHYRTRD